MSQRRTQPQRSSSRAPRNRYSLVAVLMIAVTAVGAGLMLAGVLTLSWLEIAVAAGFAMFWTVQTIEQTPPDIAA
jgi:hypothetical protein